MNNPLIETFLQFVEINPDEHIAIKEQLQVKKIAAGDFLIKAGQVPNHITIVQEGLLRKFIVSKEKENNVYFASSGEFIVDYPAYLQQKPTYYYIQALEDTVIYSLERSVIETFYVQSPKWNLLGRKIAEGVIISLYDQLEFMSLNSPKEQYDLFMEKYPHLFNRIPQYHIASYLQIEPQSLSRIRKQKSLS